MIQHQINQVEQRIKNLQRSMNAEMDSMLSQLQHLKELATNANPEASVRRGQVKEQSVNMETSVWEHIPEVLKVKDVQGILKIGRNQAYMLVESGQFHFIRIGRRLVVPKQGFIEWLEGNTSNNNG
ncbi:helix-turn-helix domain-containing protein [Paenibacillus sp. FSL L8-0436]|uniref:helix-turn-helix domain-containing protein n=1 Tax=Paenibacillus sp. FSL L8-0436 TaxID=2954686 RepID=UPI003158B9E3